MRKLAAVALAATAVGGAGVLAQQSAPAESPTPPAKAVPEKQSAGPQMSGPGEENDAGESLTSAGTAASAAGAALQQITSGERPARPGIAGAPPQAILAFARARGDARLLEDEYGDPLIEAIADGRPYDITFYDCRGHSDCQSVMLRAGFAGNGHSEADMAAWNRAQRFGKAYLDAAGNPIVELDVNLTGGVTAANLEDTFDRWTRTLDAFAGHVGY